MNYQSVKKKLPKYAGDLLLLSLAYYLALRLPAGGPLLAEHWEVFTRTVPLVVLLKLVLLYYFHQYDAFWRYTSLRELNGLVQALAIASGLILLSYFLSFSALSLAPSAFLLDWFFSLVLLGGFRILPRLVREGGLEQRERQRIERNGEGSNPTHVLLYGAGDLGASIARQIERTYSRSKRVVGFIDDNPELQKMRIHGIEVLGDRGCLPELTRKKKIDEILVTISAISGRDLNQIVQYCRKFCRNVQVAPGLNELFMGMVKINDLREVQIEDLLGREKVELDEDRLSHFLAGKRVLVTGAGGSIGSELCFQILKFNPEKLILLGRGENSIYRAKMRLTPHARPGQVEEVIGDIIHAPKLNRAFQDFRPDLVFHAAAHKHVPLMELHPDEAVRNNILGTQNVLEAASRVGVEKVVCISSDKAVNPTNVMGCCKRISELLAQSYNGRGIVSCAVRFGNVIGSRGSVIPLFRQQISMGGPITITDPEITRYFMTIPEAVLLVLQAGALAQGGEVFLLEMGRPIRIVDLARQMIRLSGLPEDRIPIEFIGLRPGEKLYEELTYPFEKPQKTLISKVFRVESRPVDPCQLLKKIAALAEVAEAMDAAAIQGCLKELVPEYRPYSGYTGQPRHSVLITSGASVSLSP